MNPKDFICNNVYRGGMKKGASESSAYRAAVSALDEYNKGRFDKVSKLIERKIAEAKRNSI
ncbi:hypothetical protein [uncultured Paraglaciecola sp.]|uniref:hypothetical protein n=1 Tax=uncultured Paraglaciecola sp. TaxID=1765024 RepID=UPI00260193A0|nr:hypothetical protein [uncultured Paraglaciecola sp.]